MLELKRDSICELQEADVYGCTEGVEIMLPDTEKQFVNNNSKIDYLHLQTEV